MNENQNLYVYGDVLYPENQIKRLKELFPEIEFEYEYVEPFIFEISAGRKIVISQEISQMEIVDDSEGVLESIYVTSNAKLIETMFIVLTSKLVN